MSEIPDPNQVLASLAQRKVALDLQTTDLCFLAALHLRAERGGLASFPEDQLVDVFDQVCEAIEPVVEARKRATHAIRRLREQRMLARVDGAGVLRAGEYALTRLATGIVEFFLEDETLTKDSLVVLTRSLRASLAEVATAARAASAPEAWAESVIAPLRLSIADLVAGIQRRQRGFDVQQERFQREIAVLLEADWFGAVERCQSLLESTSATLRELNHVLLQDTHQLHGALHEIQELALNAGAAEAEETARAVVEQVDRIAAWGGARQRAWSDYYQYVHRFLRDVVRLDPARVLTHRLRERLAGRSGKPFALTIAAAPPIRLLRAVETPQNERPPVKRRKTEREPQLEVQPPDDPQARLEANVRAALAAGARGLREVTAQIAGELPVEERFVAAGRIAHAIARVGNAEARAERPWVPLDGGIVIEEWKVEEKV